MPAFAVIGGQWGDEGKGKVIDYLAERVSAVVRFAGGNNAGHTVVNNKGEFQLHLVPSGICWPDVYGLIGNGVVVDPESLLGEIGELAERGMDTDKLFISDRAHVIMPYHVALDALEEQARGDAAIGTTGRGIGPTYMDKTARMGIRIGDLLDPESLRPRLEQTLSVKNKLITAVYDGEALDADEVMEKALEWGNRLRPYVHPTEQLVQDLLDAGNNILLEGAQGTLLDLDHGSYPYVTSSSPSIGGACTGLGLNPQAIKGVLGVYKAYSTRVGGGPMPTEVFGEAADDWREMANEFGVTTGRARRVGWFDAVAGRYSQQVNGLTGMVVTRLDILDGFPSVKICVGYSIDGQDVKRYPSDTRLLEQCVPVYEEMAGWDEPTAGVTYIDQLPENARAYVHRIEELVGCPVQIISTGRSRDETILVEPVIP